jgi:bacillithiol synthase
MNPSCLKQTLMSGTSRLFGDYLYNFDRVRGYYAWDPFCHDSFRRAAAEISYPAEKRKALVEALQHQNPNLSSLELLSAPKTVAVVTGQQVGLFSGPAYTIFKAVTAARLAQQLTQEGIPAVPIFWVSTEDHDLDEVDHAWVFDAEYSPAKLSAGVKPTAGPVGKVLLDKVPFDQLEKSFEGFAYKDAVLAMVRRAYEPGRTLGLAFLRLLRELLEPLGLIFVDPLDSKFREIAAPFLADVVEKAPQIMDSVRQRSLELERAGYHAQVFVDSETSPIFLLDQERRVGLKLRDGQFVDRQTTYSTEQLSARALDISPSALLRPVMQDFMLPTVAYVGGPAEIAYMAQCQVVYRDLLGRMPVIVPRNGFTLVDDHTTKLLNRYKLQVSDVFCHPDELRRRIANRLVPATVAESLSRAQTHIAAELSNVENVLSDFDPSLTAALQKSAAKIQYQLEKIATKTATETIRRDEQAARAANRLANALYPNQHLQERVYSILPFVAQHGPELIPRLFRAAQLACPDHMVRSISDLD